jgi:hypothetical protein
MQFFGEKQEKMKRFSPLCMLLSDCVQTNARFACQKKAQPVTHCQTTLCQRTQQPSLTSRLVGGSTFGL